MKLKDFDYYLPKNLIAQKPVSPRDSSRLMVLNRKTGKVSHFIFKDLINLLDPADVLVFNQSKVFPARLFGRKNTGGRVEVFLLKPISENTWQALTGGKVNIEQTLSFSDQFRGEVIKKLSGGLVNIKFNQSNNHLLKTINKLGYTPLPPYIKSLESEQSLRKLYQTVYAKESGSVAAPTAGLHFTKHLLEVLKQKGVQMEFVTLHVGLGTFKPISEDQIKTRKLHSENYILDQEAAKRLNLAKKSGRKIIAVGTTSARVLEGCVNNNGLLKAGSGEIELFINPPYKFKFINGLITNFHLPKSSLLMLISAFVSKPNTCKRFTNFANSIIGKAYKEAIEDDYRFFSFGDAMLIW